MGEAKIKELSRALRLSYGRYDCSASTLAEEQWVARHASDRLRGINAVTLIISGMFAGLSIRSFVAPRLVSGVGHIRTVVALAAVTSAAALMHLAPIRPWVSIKVCSLTDLTIGGQVLRFPHGWSFNRRSREE